MAAFRERLGSIGVHLRLLGAAWVGLAGAACSSSADDVPYGGAELAITTVSRPDDPRSLVFETAVISLRKLSLVPCSADAATLSTYDWPADLFREAPARVTFESSVVEQCGVDFELGPATAALPAELDGFSSVVSGTRDDDSRFKLRSALSERFTLRATGPVDAMHLVLGVDLVAWFADTELHDAALTDSVALVDSENNAEVLDVYEANTASAFALYEDTDGDGTLSDDELTPVAFASVR